MSPYALICVCVLINRVSVLQVWNLGPSKVERVMIELEIPHQLDGPNGQKIFMHVYKPQVREQFVYFIVETLSMSIGLLIRSFNYAISTTKVT